VREDLWKTRGTVARLCQSDGSLVRESWRDTAIEVTIAVLFLDCRAGRKGKKI
jgi:hypothetical protein